MREYYLWLGISALVGGLSGFHDVHAQFETDSGKAAKTVWCWLYLSSRAALAVGAFLAGGRLSFLDKELFMRALFCGVSAEALIRAQFFVKSVKIDNKSSRDVTWSPLFGLLRWYQDLLLTTIVRKFAKEIRALVEEIASRFSSFAEMYAFFDQQVAGWKKDNRVGRLQKDVAVQKWNFAEDVDPQTDRALRQKLGYLIADHLGFTDTKEFFRPKPAA
jgi:hypothetical protein